MNTKDCTDVESEVTAVPVVPDSRLRKALHLLVSFDTIQASESVQLDFVNRISWAS